VRHCAPSGGAIDQSDHGRERPGMRLKFISMLVSSVIDRARGANGWHTERRRMPDALAVNGREFGLVAVRGPGGSSALATRAIGAGRWQCGGELIKVG